MNEMTESCAHLVDQLEQFVSHSHIDTHLSCSINSAFEVDEMLLNMTMAPQCQTTLRQSELACRLGVISSEKVT